MGGDRTSVSRTIDVARLREALKGAGIDPRAWVSYGKVLEDPVVDATGFYAQVQLVPLEIEVTCRIAATYAGPGYGAWFPLAKDDEVLVAIPDGEYDSGCVVVARMANDLDAPPTEFTNERPVVKAKDGKDMLFLTSGGGAVILGSANATSHAVKHEELDAALGTYHNFSFLPHVHSGGTLGGGLTGSVNPLPPTPAPNIAAAKSPSVVVE